LTSGAEPAKDHDEVRRKMGQANEGIGEDVRGKSAQPYMGGVSGQEEEDEFVSSAIHAS